MINVLIICPRISYQFTSISMCLLGSCHPIHHILISSPNGERSLPSGSIFIYEIIYIVDNINLSNWHTRNSVIPWTCIQVVVIHILSLFLSSLITVIHTRMFVKMSWYDTDLSLSYEYIYIYRPLSDREIRRFQCYLSFTQKLDTVNWTNTHIYTCIYEWLKPMDISQIEGKTK